MSLENLPNELLLLIISAVDPDTLPRFIGTCRRFKSLAGSRLKQHRLLHATYKSVTLQNPARHPLGLIDDILRQPDIAYYVSAISFTSDMHTLRCTTFDPPNDHYRALLREMKNSEKFSQLQAWLTFYLPADSLRRRLEQVSCGFTRVTFGLLLLMLNSLRKLRLHGQHHPPYLYRDIVEVAVNDSNVLGKLEIVECCAVNVNCRRVVLPFLVLPTVKVFRAQYMNDFVCRWPDLALNRPILIETLELANACLSAKTLGRLLQPMQALKTFRYHCTARGGDTLSNGGVATASEILSILVFTMVNSLTTLSLSGCQKGECEVTLVCLRALKNLRELEIDFALLTPAAEHNCNKLRGKMSRATRSSDRSIPHLVHIMPQSLERLTMKVEGYEEDLAHFLRVLRGYETNWPANLRKIRLSCGRVVYDQDMLADMAARGITLEYILYGRARTSYPAHLAYWDKEF